jgi:CHAT domain-containing protein
VRGLLYAVSAEIVSALVLDGPSRQSYVLGHLADLLPHIDLLRDELRDPLAVARGRVPKLAKFAETWGRQLIPAPILAAPPDVLVVFPHSFLHDLPLHLVASDGGEPLGVRCGMAYSSSWSLFARCVTRNPARAADAPRSDRLTVFAAGADMLATGDDRFARLADSIAKFFGAEPEHPAPPSTISRSDLKFRLRTRPPKDLLCLAMHGYVDPDDHRLSGLLLSGEGRYAPRYFWSASNTDPSYHTVDVPFRMLSLEASGRHAEVLTLQEMELENELEAELVIMLGCSAGLGETVVGDRSVSVAQVFIDLGASALLAPLWDIDFTAAERWVSAFLTAWAGHAQPKALAARDALSTLLSDGYGPERTGAFALRGDWL